MISLVWSTVRSSPMNYNAALGVSDFSLGGRYLYPVLMAWFVAGIILRLRHRTIQEQELRVEGCVTLRPPPFGHRRSW
jgi:hypothetical protein